MRLPYDQTRATCQCSLQFTHHVAARDDTGNVPLRVAAALKAQLAFVQVMRSPSGPRLAKRTLGGRKETM